MSLRAGSGALTMDEEFDSMQANIIRFHESIQALQSRVSETLKTMKAYCKASHESSELFKAFYEKNPERLNPIVIRYESAHHNMATAKYEMLEKFMRDNVFSRCEAFDTVMKTLMKRIKDRLTAREKFDHYYSKLLKLKLERDLAIKRGKPLGPKEIERISRNEKKFEDAKIAYWAVHKTVAKEIWDQWRQRFSVMDPLFNEVVKTETLFLTAVSNQLNTILPDLKKLILIAPADEPSEPPCMSARAPPGLEEFEQTPAVKAQTAKKKTAAINSFEEENEFDEAVSEEEIDSPKSAPQQKSTGNTKQFIDEVFSAGEEKNENSEESKKTTTTKKTGKKLKAKKKVSESESEESEEEKPKKKTGKKKGKSTAAAAATAEPIDFFASMAAAAPAET